MGSYTSSGATTPISSNLIETSSPCPSPLTDYDDADHVMIHIPDLFTPLMKISGDDLVNPNYDNIKAEADKWVSEVLKLDYHQARRNSRADFALLSACWVPAADEMGLRLMTDWNHWVFWFDDQFDEGHLKLDPIKAAEEVIHSLHILNDACPDVSVDDKPIHHIFQIVWRVFKERASTDLQTRFIELHQRYMIGCLKQVHWMSRDSTNLSIEQYLDYRRDSVGTYPAFAVVECATGIDLPPSVMKHDCIVACEEVITDIVILGNDVLSMAKDMQYGVEHNIVSRLRALGLSMQEAVDKVAGMLDECYRRWYEALAKMPSWGHDTDRQVLKLLQGYQNVALGTVHWSFECGRYLGPNGPEVRETRMMKSTLSPGLEEPSISDLR